MVAMQDNVDPVMLAEVAATTVVLISTSMVARAISMLNIPSAACSAVEVVYTSCLGPKTSSIKAHTC